MISLHVDLYMGRRLVERPRRLPGIYIPACLYDSSADGASSTLYYCANPGTMPYLRAHAREIKLGAFFDTLDDSEVLVVHRMMRRMAAQLCHQRHHIATEIVFLQQPHVRRPSTLNGDSSPPAFLFG